MTKWKVTHLLWVLTSFFISLSEQKVLKLLFSRSLSVSGLHVTVCCCLSLCVGPTDWACTGLAVVLVNKKLPLRAGLGWAARMWLWGCSSISEKLESFSDPWTISAPLVLNMNSWTTTNAAAEKLIMSNLHHVSNVTEVFPSLLISHYLYYFIIFCPQVR